MKFRRYSIKAVLFSFILISGGQLSAADLIYTVTTTADSGGSTDEGSLRNGIDQVNLDLKDKIVFDISDFGPHVIAPNTPLPSVENTVEIDGLNRQTCVVLDGSNLALDTGLAFLEADNSSVKGLKIVNFLNGIRIVNTSGMVIKRNLISKNGVGVHVVSGENNLIGGSDLFFGSSYSGNSITKNCVGVRVGSTCDQADAFAIILSNNICDNEKIGIEFCDQGFLPNLDCINPGKQGPNNLLCHPRLTAAFQIEPKTFLILGSYVGAPETEYIIQLFANDDSCRKTRNTEGCYLINEFKIKTNEHGKTSFKSIIKNDLNGRRISATATLPAPVEEPVLCVLPPKGRPETSQFSESIVAYGFESCVSFDCNEN